MAYRLYPDGHRELVRGIDISGTPLVALQSIRAASREVETFNGVCGAESGWVPVIGVGAEPAAREARDREGVHPARPAAGARIRPRSRTRRCPVKQALAASLCSPCSRPATPRSPRRSRRRRPQLGGASTAVTNEILDTIAEEMNRAMTELQIPGATPSRTRSLQDHRGRRQRRRRRARPDHVEAQPPLRQPRGARPRRQPQTSTTATSSSPGDRDRRRAAFNLPLEADAADRRARRLARHRPGLQGGADPAPRQARGPQGRRHAAPERGARVDRRQAGRRRGAGARARARDARRARERARRPLGGVPRPADLRDSRVAFTSYLERRWYITTDGTSAHRHAPRSRRADRGQRPGRRRPAPAAVLPPLRPHRARTCPTTRTSPARSKRLADTIVALAKAPVIGHATPARCCSRARARPAWCATRWRPTSAARRCPRGCRRRRRKAVRRRAHRQGRPQACCRRSSRSSTIPPPKDGDGNALIGGYKIDDEGVAAQKVEVVEGRHAGDAAAPAARRRRRTRSRTATRGAPPTAARSTAARPI